METMTNKKIELMLPKGMRDLDPEDKIRQLQVLDIIREVFELYGYLPIETPLVERMDVLNAKFAAGEDTDVSKEIFQVKDQGDRDLGLRFDMTVPLARYAAMNPTIKMPFKRYVMGKVFRDGPIKLGRYREFWQADADIIGAPGVEADCEGVRIAADVFQKLGLDITFYFSSRELLYEMMDKLEISSDKRSKTLISLDKLKKIGEKGVLAEMKEAGLAQEKAENLLEMTASQGTNLEKIELLKKHLPESKALEKLEAIINNLSHLNNLVFDPSLSRGLEYYTGFFFEAFLNKSKITSSLIGTGRYDKMIGQYLNSKQDIPGVGISFGVSVICDALEEKTDTNKRSFTQVFVVAVSDKERDYAQKIASDLRDAGINTDMDLLARGIGKNFAFADALGIPYVVVVGEDEMKQNKCTLKNMSDGTQEEVELSKLSEKVKD